MDLISGYKTVLSRVDRQDHYLNETQSSILLTESDCPDYAEIMLAEEVEKKGDPVKGRRYLWFNIFMVVFLSLWVLMNTTDKTIEKQASSNLKEASKGIFNAENH